MVWCIWPFSLSFLHQNTSPEMDETYRVMNPEFLISANSVGELGKIDGIMKERKRPSAFDPCNTIWLATDNRTL